MVPRAQLASPGPRVPQVLAPRAQLVWTAPRAQLVWTVLRVPQVLAPRAQLLWTVPRAPQVLVPRVPQVLAPRVPQVLVHWARLDLKDPLEIQAQTGHRA